VETKKLSEITKKEWVKFNWIDVTEAGDQERVMLKSLQRTPEEAMGAVMQWEETEEYFIDEEEKESEGEN
jgi:hypothetical protein